MIVDMTKIKTYYISLLSQPEKQKRMEEMLSKVGIKNFEHEPGQIPREEFLHCGPHCHRNAIGCGQCHQSIYERNKEFPFMVLEDDAHIMEENFESLFEIPDECDCLYLGISSVGLYTVSSGLFIVEDYNEKFFRIKGMYAAHAIVYLNETYLNKHLESIKRCLKTGWPFDVGYAQCQYNGIVLAPKKHWFYQSPISENSTKPYLTPFIK